MEQGSSGGEGQPVSLLGNIARTADFWGRTVGIYGGYTATQAQAWALEVAGWSPERLTDELWARQHRHAAEQMYRLCVDLRGFYLKVRCARRN